MSDRVIVMKDGSICDDLPPAELRRSPTHGYTRDLLNSMALLDVQGNSSEEGDVMTTLVLRNLRKEFRVGKTSLVAVDGFSSGTCPRGNRRHCR